MIKTTLTIDGMMCGMCEAHVNDVVRKNATVKSVKSSAKKGICEIVSEEEPDIELLKAKIGETGYTVKDSKSEPYEKKGLFHR